MTGPVQCAASGVLVDPPVPVYVSELRCPSCGSLVCVGGSPRAPRYQVHNEPTRCAAASAEVDDKGAGMSITNLSERAAS